MQSEKQNEQKTTLSVFISQIDSSSIPICRSDALSLGHLLIRETDVSGSAQKKSLKKMHLAPRVDVSLLESIRHGKFLSAAMKSIKEV